MSFAIQSPNVPGSELRSDYFTKGDISTKMKIRFAVIVTIALATSGAAQVSAQMKKAPAKTALAAEFKVMIDQYYAAWSTLDPDKAARYYAKTPISFSTTFRR